MQVKAKLDLDVIAVEQDDMVSVMLELEAPPAPATRPRQPATIEVVLDRSGSMAGERLEAAKAALLALVDRLDPADQLGVVTFDDQIGVDVPAGPVADGQGARARVAVIAPGGTTNLSGGLLRGVQEARRVRGEAGATLLLISDGHANEGEVDPDRLAQVAATAAAHGVTVSTIGVGLGYDERLLAAIARGGRGGHAFAEHGDGAAAALAGEVDGLLSRTIQAASLEIRPDAPVDSVTVWNDAPAQPVGEAITVELGDLWAGERRRLLLSFAVPARQALGLARIAELTLRYVTLPELIEETAKVPVHVNVVPGDQAAGRIPDAVVRTELQYQQAQAAKRKAAERLSDGDVAGAQACYRAARTALHAAPIADAEIDEEDALLDRLSDRLAAGEAAWAGKLSRADAARKSRLRGRGPSM